jgi:hypothetical protein
MTVELFSLRRYVLQPIPSKFNLINKNYGIVKCRLYKMYFWEWRLEFVNIGAFDYFHLAMR